MLSFLCEVISKIGGKPECRVILQYSMISSVLLLGGILGGIGRGAFDWLMGNNGLGKNWYKHLGWHALIGIAGSGSGTFIALMFSKYELDASRLDSLVLYTGIAIFSGLMIKSLLPSLDHRILKLLENKVDSMFGTYKEFSNHLVDLVALADDALNIDKPSYGQISSAIARMEAGKSSYRTVRAFNIKLGRLYRKMSELDPGNFDEHINNAISTLKNFEREQRAGKQTQEVKESIATAKFNIACYLSLKRRKETQDSIRNALQKEILLILNEATDLDPSLAEEVKNDPDFDNNIKDKFQIRD